MSRLDRLRQLETLTMESIERADAEKRAPLIGQMRGILAEIEALDMDAQKKAGDPIDEIATRRAARGGATSRLGHSKRSS